ncbi:hypothetical protein GGG16DRAFT_65129 [Schizophyllum commune]
MHPVRDVHLERLNHACRNIYAIKESGASDASARLRINEEVAKILGVLRRGTPQNAILAYEPPTAMPLREFVSDENWDARADLVGQTLACSGLLCNLSFVLHRPDLCPFDARFFLAAFNWMDYLTPQSRITDLASADAHIRAFYLPTFTHLCVSFLQGFTQFLPQERVREVMKAGDERATDVMVRLWMDWPDIVDQLDAAHNPEERKSVIYGSFLVLPTHYKQVENDDYLRSRVVDSIISSVNNRPRRFFRVYAQYIRYTIRHPVADDEEKFMGNIFRALDIFSRERRLGMPGRVSRKLLSAIMDCIRHNVRRAPSSIVWKAGWNCLESVCLRHTHNFNRAIEVNLLGCMVAIRIAAPRTAVLARMYRMIDGLSVSTRAVRAYRKFWTLPVASMELEFYGPQELRILKTFDYHDTVVAEAETSWERVATCCNAACPMGEGRSDDLQACSCGEAVYCSSACQRAHWVDGRHSVECASRHETEYGILAAKDMNLAVAEARIVLQKVFDSLTAEPADPGYTPRVLVNTSIRNDGWPLMEISKEKADGRMEESPYVIVDFAFEQAKDIHMRRIWFLPERYAGYVRHPYRLLSQAFFDNQGCCGTDPIVEGRRSDNEDPPRLTGLTSRERLFGRSEGATWRYPQDVR